MRRKLQRHNECCLPNMQEKWRRNTQTKPLQTVYDNKPLQRHSKTKFQRRLLLQHRHPKEYCLRYWKNMEHQECTRKYDVTMRHWHSPRRLCINTLLITELFPHIPVLSLFRWIQNDWNIIHPRDIDIPTLIFSTWKSRITEPIFPPTPPFPPFSANHLW